ncbi:MAG: IS4 family transposase, partial [Bacteroidota bacterium]
MKTNSYFNSKVRENFEKFFDKSIVNRIGISSGFCKRKAQKITAYHFVAGFIACCCKQVNTFSNWAAQIELLTGQRISKQAVFKRLYQAEAVVFLKKLVQRVIIERSRVGSSSLFKGFGKVLLQDSTTLRLPDRLAPVFKGNTTNGEQKSQVRIQTTLNVQTMRFLQFTLSSFTQNDQSASGQILTCAGKGDLIIRDLGYFVLNVFKDIIDAKAHFLSRLRYGVLLFHPDGRPIKILSLLRGKAVIDLQVCIGKQKIPVRLVMLRLPRAQVAERVRKARYNRDKNLNHSEDYYRLLAYAVYITTV